LIGSVAAGRAIMRAASETVKPVLLELGGKNALIAYPDANVDDVAAGIVAGMNFTWCGQSCGSTSRAFVHASIYDAVVAAVAARVEAYRPGIPTDEATMLAQVNGVEYGLTCSIWTDDLSTAYRTAMAVQVGYVWINEVGKHFLGAPFGGVKQSGFGREECIEEMLGFTQEKNIHVK